MLCVGAAVRGRFYCAAIVIASIAIGATSQATAATYYWHDSEPGLYFPERPVLQHRQHGRRNPAKATRAAEKEAAKPQGPLILAVSVNKQQVKVYDANGLFTQAPVSTGMAGHATPMGVFSVIQKQKFHRSNIYSGAPMPFMQRITWSGIALHAGVLPGYPASHGCIRMPPGFAVKMYGWTRMGARVLVTPGETSPSSIEHPLLAAFRAPQPTAATQPDANAPAASKTDKGADAGRPTTIGADLELRASIGHDDGTKPAADLASAPLRGQTRTADAGSATGVIMVSDATPDPVAAPRTEASPGDRKAETASAPKADDSTAKTESKPDEAVSDIPTKPGSPVRAEGIDKAAATPADGAAKADPAPAAASRTTASKPVDAKPVDAKPADAKPADAKPANAKAATDTAATDKAQADKPEGTAKAADVNPADTKPADAKDPARLTAGDKPTPQKPELKHSSQVAIFISRKDSKLYVRQNFAPVFSTPVTIAPSDRPLGTHVFTAVTDKTDPSVMHWSVISLPASRSLTRIEVRGSRRNKKGSEAEVKVAPVPDSPAEALDRITISPDVVAWLGEALSNGSSLIVSDQGINQGETGEGTDFIVSLR